MKINPITESFDELIKFVKKLKLSNGKKTQNSPISKK